MAPRRRPNRLIEKDVMIASRRRCCLCVFLNNRNEVRKGQIAHLNRDSGDSRFENLVYLCLEHHDEYDSRPSQSKALLFEEVRDYRDRLYAENSETNNVARHTSRTAELAPLPDISEYEVLRKRFPNELGLPKRSISRSTSISITPSASIAGSPKRRCGRRGRSMNCSPTWARPILACSA